jgi:hypothetical protein
MQCSILQQPGLAHRRCTGKADELVSNEKKAKTCDRRCWIRTENNHAVSSCDDDEGDPVVELLVCSLVGWHGARPPWVAVRRYGIMLNDVKSRLVVQGPDPELC